MRKLYVLSLVVLLTACSRDMNSSSYVDSSASGVVLEGTIVSARPVIIKGADKLGNNSAGLLGGGVAGGVLGSTIGRGNGSVVDAVGGALAGAVLGSVVESQLSESDGIEYIVKVNRDNTGSAKTSADLSINKKPSSPQIETNLKTELISVIQGKDVIYNAGQPVYVIYSDDRPRLVSRQ